jgi:inosine-uridine nucleoside N-ribohydrolase
MKKVIIDCDPGHDDALAILLAAGHLDVLGITTVGGNQTLEKVTNNTLKILECAGLTHIPVARGMGEPLMAPRIDTSDIHGPDVHGTTGLDGPELPEPDISIIASHGVDFIVDTVMSTNDVTLIPTGPLTNVASALRREPRIKDRLAGISLMGGNLAIGNVTATAEFNIYVDPLAAHIVFSSGVPVKMCGINLTRQVMATDVEIGRIRSLNNRVGTFVADLLDFYVGSIKRLYGLPGGALHDPCAVVPLINPQMIQFEPMRVAIERYGEHTTGMTVCDYRHLQDSGNADFRTIAQRKGAPPYTDVGLKINRDRFFDLLIETLATYP